MDIYKTINFPLKTYLHISLLIWLWICIETIKSNIYLYRAKADKSLQKEYIVDTIISIIIYSFITFINTLFIIQLNKYSINHILYPFILVIWCFPWVGLLSLGMLKLFELLNWSCNNCYIEPHFLFYIQSFWRGTQLKNTIKSILGLSTR